MTSLFAQAMLGVDQGGDARTVDEGEARRSPARPPRARSPQAGPRTPVNSGAVAMSSSPLKKTMVSPSRPTTLAENPPAEVLMVDRCYPTPRPRQWAPEPAATQEKPASGRRAVSTVTAPGSPEDGEGWRKENDGDRAHRRRYFPAGPGSRGHQGALFRAGSRRSGTCGNSCSGSSRNNWSAMRWAKRPSSIRRCATNPVVMRSPRPG